MNPVAQSSASLTTAVGIPPRLRQLAGELVAFLEHPARQSPDEYEVIETHLVGFQRLTRSLDAEFAGTTDELRAVQQWFRDETDPVFRLSKFYERIRAWPAGQPGDYLTLEQVYRNEACSAGVGYHLDRYGLSRPLAVGVRSRMRTLARLLELRAAAEAPAGNWLNLGCGSCRELLSLPDDSASRTIHCVDTDRDALAFAERLLAGKRIGTTDFLAENALRFCRADRNVRRFGAFSTIYSAGLFDYLTSDALSRLLGALWDSLREGGLLIAPFKDAQRYDTFDYHWLSKWHFFYQREEGQYREILANAGIPDSAVRVQRDDSGLILFFLIGKSAQDEEPEEIEAREAQWKFGGKTWRVDGPGGRKHIHG